jgi:hypothetical protein
VRQATPGEPVFIPGPAEVCDAIFDRDAKIQDLRPSSISPINALPADDVVTFASKSNGLRHMIKRVGIAMCAVALGMSYGCVTEPTPADGTASYAYAVGDRERVAFDEIVVSLKLNDDPAPYENLHVALTAFVNPRRATKASLGDAESIVRRCERRLTVHVTATLSSLGPQTLVNGQKVRQDVKTEAQEIVDDAMKQWKDGGDFQVEIAVASWYWTSSSVGRVSPTQRGFFD